MILHMKDPKDFTKKLLSLINIFRRIKKATKKSVAFPYTNGKDVEKEIKETVPLITA